MIGASGGAFELWVPVQKRHRVKSPSNEHVVEGFQHAREVATASKLRDR
jgi:hypothetical protein